MQQSTIWKLKKIYIRPRVHRVGFSSQSSIMHDVQTLSAGQMLQKGVKNVTKMQEAS